MTKLYTIKPLRWAKVDARPAGLCEWWYAPTPSTRTGSMAIHEDQGRFYPSWDMFPADGYPTVQQAKDAGQSFHNDYITHFLIEVTGG